MATLLTEKSAKLHLRPEKVTESEPPGTDSFADLTGHKYIRLTTMRRSGQAVHTPVWFVAEAGRLYVRTSTDSGKVKRIRNNPRVLVAASNPMGKALSSPVRATTRILPSSEQEHVSRALLLKYGGKCVFSTKYCD
jgi:uncharacterized protein